jgi:hypothetical protein
LGRLATWSLLAGVIVFGCSSDSSLRPFASDGCSLFPDASLISGDDWCSCCFEHDIAYWKGGTAGEREAADLALMQCVAAKTGDEQLAATMHAGVRLGGSPYFYNWYRWGYGWGYERKYQALSPTEHERAAVLLEQYYAAGAPASCQ